MPAYDGVSFQPPAPLARVILRNQTTGARWEDVPMLIDTGADITLIPVAAVSRLSLEPLANKHYELLDFNSVASLAQVVQLDLLFLGKSFRGQFLLIDQQWGILGRNVLNAIRLLLNGPALEWEEYKTGG